MRYNTPFRKSSLLIHHYHHGFHKYLLNIRYWTKMAWYLALVIAGCDCTRVLEYPLAPSCKPGPFHKPHESRHDEHVVYRYLSGHIYPIGCNAKSVRKPEGMKGCRQFKTGAKLVPTTTRVVSRRNRLRKYVARKLNLIKLMTPHGKSLSKLTKVQ